jgi:hypothetical protein
MLAEGRAASTKIGRRKGIGGLKVPEMWIAARGGV